MSRVSARIATVKSFQMGRASATERGMRVIDRVSPFKEFKEVVSTESRLLVRVKVRMRSVLLSFFLAG